jgi:hypothetical protein
MGRLHVRLRTLRVFVVAATFLMIGPNLSLGEDRDGAREKITGFPASEFCFYGGRAYSVESRLCGGVAQLLTCKQGQENNYAHWQVTPTTPEPCPVPPQALGLGP